MPPSGRHGPQSLYPNFQHMQQPQYQQNHQPHQHHQAQHNAMQIPTARLGGHPGFMSGMSLPGANMNNSGFDGARLADGGGTGLASHSAQMSFARGGQMPPPQQGRIMDGQIGNDGKAGQANSRIRNVWKSNLASEMKTLRQLVDKYPYIAMVKPSHQFSIAPMTDTPARTQNFLELWHVRLDNLLPKLIITTKHYDAMSTS